MFLVLSWFFICLFSLQCACIVVGLYCYVVLYHQLFIVCIVLVFNFDIALLNIIEIEPLYQRVCRIGFILIGYSSCLFHLRHFLGNKHLSSILIHFPQYTDDEIKQILYSKTLPVFKSQYKLYDNPNFDKDIHLQLIDLLVNMFGCYTRHITQFFQFLAILMPTIIKTLQHQNHNKNCNRNKNNKNNINNKNNKNAKKNNKNRMQNDNNDNSVDLRSQLMSSMQQLLNEISNKKHFSAIDFTRQYINDSCCHNGNMNNMVHFDDGNGNLHRKNVESSDAKSDRLSREEIAPDLPKVSMYLLIASYLAAYNSKAFNLFQFRDTSDDKRSKRRVRRKKPKVKTCAYVLTCFLFFFWVCCVCIAK